MDGNSLLSHKTLLHYFYCMLLIKLYFTKCVIILQSYIQNTLYLLNGVSEAI